MFSKFGGGGTSACPYTVTHLSWPACPGAVPGELEPQGTSFHPGPSRCSVCSTALPSLLLKALQAGPGDLGKDEKGHVGFPVHQQLEEALWVWGWQHLGAKSQGKSYSGPGTRLTHTHFCVSSKGGCLSCQLPII